MQIRELSKDLQAKAETELNEKPEQIESDLEAFKVWLERTPYINARTDDQFLVSFLRGCKFSLERAKAKIDSFYSIRAAIPETYGKRAVTDDIIDLIKLGVFVPVPKTDGPAGNRIIIYRPSFDPDKMDVTYAIRGFGMLMDIMMLEDDNLIVSGTEYIADLSGMKLAHVRGLTPMYLKKIVMAYQDGNPVRIKGIHYVNMPSFFLTIFNLVKAFLSEKLRSRIKVHESFEKLYENISREILPAEYGGEGGHIPDIMEAWVTKLREYEDFFKDDVNYGTNEKLRPGRPKNAETLFGVEGTFRQMEFF